MNYAVRVLKILVPSQAGIIKPTLVDVINGAACLNAPGHNGNSVDGQAKAIFALAHCIFRPLALGNVLRDDKSGSVRKKNYGTSSIDSPAVSDFDFEVEPLSSCCLN